LRCFFQIFYNFFLIKFILKIILLYTRCLKIYIFKYIFIKKKNTNSYKKKNHLINSIQNDYKIIIIDETSYGCFARGPNTYQKSIF